MGKISIALLVALFSGLLSTVAMAQPMVSIRPNVTRDHQDNAGRVPVTQINRKDCLTEDRFTLPIELTQYEGYALELWAGDSCDFKANRRPGTGTCWRLAGVPSHVESVSIEVSVRDLLSGRTSESAPCEEANPTYAPQVLTIYAMLIDGADNLIAMSTYKTTYKLSRPDPQEIEYVSSGDRRALVKLGPIVSDQYYNGVLLFCDPPPGDPNAAANTQTMTDNAGVFVPVCSQSAELIPGADASTLMHLRCGMANKSALIPVATDLVNGVSYNIALASTDTYGNVGPLSPVACQVPQTRADHRTVNACAFSGVSRSGRASVLVALLALGAVCRRRLRRVPKS